MRVALVFIQAAGGEVPSRALAIESLAGELRRAHRDCVEVGLWDLQCLSVEEAITQIAAFRPDMVGASVPIGAVALARQVLPALRALPEAPTIVVGNLVATNAPAEVLAIWPWAILVRGEGEAAMRELVRRRLSGSGELAGIPGLCWRLPTGEEFICPPAVEGEFGGWAPDLWPQVLGGGGQAIVEASRGCPGHCSFCSSRNLHPDGWRRRPVADLVEELHRLHDFGVSRVFFADDDFVGGGWREAVAAAQVIHAAVPGLTWGTALRADSVSRADGAEGLRLLAEFGMRDVLVGIESGSATQLARLGKRANVERNAVAIARIRETPLLNLHAGFLLDPLMTADELRDTASFVLDHDLAGAISNPLQVVEVHAGTKLAQVALAAGVRGKFDLDSMTWDCAWLHPDVGMAVANCQAVDAHLGPLRKLIQFRYRSMTRRAVGGAAPRGQSVTSLATALMAIKRWQIEFLRTQATSQSSLIGEQEWESLSELIIQVGHLRDSEINALAQQTAGELAMLAKRAEVG